MFGAIKHSRAKGARAMTVYFPDLLEEYKQLLKRMKADGVTSGDLYREVQQAIQWMEIGYDPALVRASTRVDAYPVDPYHMQTYASYLNDYISVPDYLMKLSEQENVDESELNKDLEKSYERKQQINGALRGLTDNEKAVFIAIEAEYMTIGKVAKMLGVERGTVQSYLTRAWYKVKRNVEYGTQDCLFDDIA